MSERGSFATEYIYNENDYKTIRKALDQNDKYLCVCPPAFWNNGEQGIEMPIVSGKAGGIFPNMEWKTIAEAVNGVITHNEVKTFIMCEAGMVVMVKKSPSGEVRCYKLEEKP